MTQSVVALVLTAGVALAQNPPPAPPAVPPKPTASCKSYMTFGDLYYERSQWENAYTMYRACNVLERDNVMALVSLGRTELRLKLYSAAIEHLKQAINANPQFLSAYIVLSQAYTDQYASAKDDGNSGLLKQALLVLDDAERVAQKADDKAKVVNQRGLVYLKSREADKALAAFRQAAQLSPKSDRIWFNLGSTLLATSFPSGNKDKIEEASEALLNAVNLSPNDAINRATYTKALRLKGDFKGCTSQGLQAINSSNLAKRDAFVVGQYGICLYLAKDLNGALVQLETAIKTNGTIDYVENYYYLGRLYLDLGRAKDAVTLLSQATFLEIRDPDLWYYLGKAQEATGNKTDASKAYAKAISLRPNYAEAQKALDALKP
jgi:tetratricopeptide (TPR) repeat protein